jgi:hypothetical protein
MVLNLLQSSESYSLVDYKKESGLPKGTYTFKIIYDHHKSPVSVLGMDGESDSFIIRDKGKLEEIVKFVKENLEK